MDLLEMSYHEGRYAELSRTVSESDVYLFGGITGDLAPYHTNEQLMRSSIYGGRVVHGALFVGLASGVSVDYWQRADGAGRTVSLGYDRVRFPAAANIGQTITLRYAVSSVDVDRRRVGATVTAVDESGATVMSAIHLTKVIDVTGPSARPEDAAGAPMEAGA
jgi:acyl dehydratase